MTLRPSRQLLQLAALPNLLTGTGSPEHGPGENIPLSKQFSSVTLELDIESQLYHFLVCDFGPQFLHLYRGNDDS